MRLKTIIHGTPAAILATVFLFLSPVCAGSADIPEFPPMPADGPQTDKPPALPENAAQEDPVAQWVERQGGNAETDKNKARAPALEMRKARPAVKAQSQEPSIQYADPSLKAREKEIKEKMPGSRERGTAKEKEFFEKNKLALEIDHLPKEKLHGAPKALPEPAPKDPSPAKNETPPAPRESEPAKAEDSGSVQSVPAENKTPKQDKKKP